MVRFSGVIPDWASLKNKLLGLFGSFGVGMIVVVVVVIVVVVVVVVVVLVVVVVVGLTKTYVLGGKFLGFGFFKRYFRFLRF